MWSPISLVGGSGASRPDRCCVGHQVVMKKTRLYLYYQMKGSCWGLTDEAIWTYVTIIIQPLQKFENPSLPLHHSIPRFFMWYSNEGKKGWRKAYFSSSRRAYCTHQPLHHLPPHTTADYFVNTVEQHPRLYVAYWLHNNNNVPSVHTTITLHPGVRINLWKRCKYTSYQHPTATNRSPPIDT